MVSIQELFWSRLRLPDSWVISLPECTRRAPQQCIQEQTNGRTCTCCRKGAQRAIQMYGELATKSSLAIKQREHGTDRVPCFICFRGIRVPLLWILEPKAVLTRNYSSLARYLLVWWADSVWSGGQKTWIRRDDR